MIKTIELDLAEDSVEGRLLTHLQSTGQLEKFILTSLKDLANKNKKSNHKEISQSDNNHNHETVSLEVMKISMDAMTNAMDKVCAIATKALDMATLSPTSPPPLSREIQRPTTVEESSGQVRVLAVEEKDDVQEDDEPDVDDFFNDEELAEMRKESKPEEKHDDIVIDDDLEDFFGDMEIEEKPMQVTQRLSMAEVLEKNRKMTVD